MVRLTEKLRLTLLTVTLQNRQTYRHRHRLLHIELLLSEQKKLMTGEKEDLEKVLDI